MLSFYEILIQSIFFLSHSPNNKFAAKYEIKISFVCVNIDDDIFVLGCSCSPSHLCVIFDWMNPLRTHFNQHIELQHIWSNLKK